MKMNLEKCGPSEKNFEAFWARKVISSIKSDQLLLIVPTEVNLLSKSANIQILYKHLQLYPKYS